MVAQDFNPKSKIQNAKSRFVAALMFHVVLCVLGLAIMFRPDWSSGFRESIIDDGDGTLNNYFLEISYQLVTNRAYAGSLWSPPFFYPARNVLAYSDNLFGSAPIYWVFRIFASPHAAMLAWMATCLALCYATFALLLRKLHVGHVLSGVGGFLFAFGMPRVAQVSHPQLMPQFLTPLAMVQLFAMLRAPTLKRLNLILLLGFWQLLAGVYLGWFLAFGFVVCLIVTLLFDRGAIRRLTTFVRGRPIAIVVSLVGWGILLLAFVAPYRQAAREHEGGWSFEYTETYLPRLGSWLQPPPGNFWRPYLGELSLHIPMRYEHCLFNGFFTPIAALAAIAAMLFGGRIPHGRRWTIKISLLTFAAVFLLSFRYLPGLSPWEAINLHFPGAKAIRAVARIWTIAYAFLIVGAMLGVDSLIRTAFGRAWLGKAAVLLLAALALSEQFTMPPFNVRSAVFLREVEEESEMMRGADAAYLVISDDSIDPPPVDAIPPGISKNLSAMMAGLRVNVPVINGYSMWSPPNYGPFEADSLGKSLVAWLGPGWHGNLRIVVESRDTAACRAIARQFPEALLSEDHGLRAFTIMLPRSGG